MKSSNAISRLILSAFFALLIAFMPNHSASAVPVVKTDGIQTSFGEQKIVIKIIIIIKRKSAGIMEIENIRMAGSNTQSLVNNEVLAEAYVEGGKFFILPLKGEGAQGQLVIPAGFKVNNAVGLKLGEKGAFGLKAGNIDFRVNKLGNFEIQD